VGILLRADRAHALPLQSAICAVLATQKHKNKKPAYASAACGQTPVAGLLAKIHGK
jgi:hypothetical protein